MITKEQFNLLDSLFDYYNNELFNGKLSDCMIITSRRRGAKGTFISDNWTIAKKTETKKDNSIHEISLNPDFLDRKDKNWQSTLVHEMVHLWQQENGKPSRGNYHNKEWARKMEEIGLMPSKTGAPGGKKTGQGMTHYIVMEGAFIKAFTRLKEKQLQFTPSGALVEMKKPTEPSARSKTKYTCPCGNKVWGKPSLSIMCNNCNQLFIEEE